MRYLRIGLISAITAAVQPGLDIDFGPVALPAFGCFDLATAVVGQWAVRVSDQADSPVRIRPLSGTSSAMITSKPIFAMCFGSSSSTGEVNSNVPAGPVPSERSARSRW